MAAARIIGPMRNVRAQPPLRIEPTAVGGFVALAALLLIGAAAVAGVTTPPSSEPAAAGTVRSVDAAGLYAANCAACHGPVGEGTANGPSLRGVGAASVDFMLRTGRMPLPAPGVPMTRGRPAFSEDEIAALVAYVAAFGGGGGPAIPDVQVSRGDVARGRELFITNCAACHGAGASGDSVGGGFVAPPLLGVDPTILGEAIRTGPGVMPVFDEAQLSPADVDAIAAYLAHLRSRSASPGGFPLAGVGPVAEGYVAWLVGAGLLVLAARWTERRRRRGTGQSSTGQSRARGDPAGHSRTGQGATDVAGREPREASGV